VELLIEALNKYEGTYVLISHDRYFVSRTANKYWEIEDGKVNAFPGTYEEWATWKEDRAERQKQAAVQASEPRKQEVKKEVKPADAREQNERKKELQKHQKEFQKVEQQVSEAEATKVRLEQAMADPQVYADNKKFKEIEQQYQACLASLSDVQQRYDSLFEKIMELES